jgi:putative membrane protein
LVARAWVAIAAALLFSVRQMWDMDDPRELGAALSEVGWLFALGILGVIALFAAWSFVVWRTTRFRITADAVHLVKGVLFRQRRQGPLARLQSVDVVRPVVARLLGLSELRLVFAGVGDAAIQLAYLRQSEATQLRAEILHRAALAAEVGVGAVPVAEVGVGGAVPVAEMRTVSGADPTAEVRTAGTAAEVGADGAVPVAEARTVGAATEVETGGAVPAAEVRTVGAVAVGTSDPITGAKAGAGGLESTADPTAEVKSTDPTPVVRAAVVPAAGVGAEVGTAGPALAEVGTVSAATTARATSLLAGDDLPGVPLAAVPWRRILAARLTTPETLVTVVLVGAVVAGLVLWNAGAGYRLAWGALPLALGSAYALLRRLTREGGFRVSADRDALHIRQGLTSQSSQSVPYDRVQTIRLQQPWFWRPWGWWRVTLTMAASQAGDTNDGGPSALLPVGPPAEAAAVTSWVVSQQDGAGRVALAALLEHTLATGLDVMTQWDGYTGIDPRGRWFAPIQWRRLGYVALPGVLALRRGRLSRQLILIPHQRTIGVDVSQGPWARRLGLATVQVYAGKGFLGQSISNLAVPAAVRLGREQLLRARANHCASPPNR